MIDTNKPNHRPYRAVIRRTRPGRLALALLVAHLISSPPVTLATPVSVRAASPQATVFHSPGDDGVTSAVPQIPVDGTPIQLNLWLIVGLLPSLPNEACSGTGTGDEVCGWDLQISATGGVELTDLVTTADVIHNLTFATQLRANGGNFVDPPAAPERIGTLSVVATAAGTVVIDGNAFATSRLQRGEIAAGLLATTNVDDADSDGDGVADANDNCTLIVNPDQRDTNADGYGNNCDADLNNDGIVNVIDLGLLRLSFFVAGDTDADFNGDLIVNAVDLGILKAGFFAPPGPSGLASTVIESREIKR